MEILTTIGLGVLISNLVVSTTYPSVICFINYVFRKKYNCWVIEEYKQSLLGCVNLENTFLCQFTFYGVLLMICAMGAVVLKATSVGSGNPGEDMLQSFYYILLVLIIASMLPVLRWLVDVSRNLKIKKSTGDSEKLADLQKQINELKSKGDSDE